MSEQREALAEVLYGLFGSTLYGHDIGPWDSERVEAEHPRWLTAADALLDSPALARLLADAEQRGADRVAATVEAALHRLSATLGGVVVTRYETEIRAALTTGAADRVRADEVPAQVESLHEELLRGDDDADQLRAVIFRLAEDVTCLKRVCHQEHPPKMGSPTRDWPAGTETRHSDGARCVLLNDGDYTLIHSPEQDVDQ